jgi:hypothetical protein
MRMNVVRAEKLGSEANGLISIERLAGVDHHREKPRVCPNVQCNAGINSGDKSIVTLINGERYANRILLGAA